MRSLITQELKGWPGSNHGLHGLWLTTIKVEKESVSSIQIFSQKTLSQNGRKKDPFLITTNILYLIPQKQFIPQDIHYITNRFIKYLDNLSHGIYMFSGDNLFPSHQILPSLY